MINKYVFKISTVFILLLIVVLIISGCSMGADSKYESSSRTSPKETESSVQENIPQNETIVLLSPDGKYRAEAYGTLTDITAGGFFPYEGVRVIDVKSEEVLWNKEPGGYTVKFLWSSDSRYVGIYFTYRIWGESVVADAKDKKEINLPKLSDLASHFGEEAKPHQDRPDPYLEITEWKDSETVIVDFRWIKEDGDEFTGRYTYNVKTGVLTFQ
jgi:hypothetical protein